MDTFAYFDTISNDQFPVNSDKVYDTIKKGDLLILALKQRERNAKKKCLNNTLHLEEGHDTFLLLYHTICV